MLSILIPVFNYNIKPLVEELHEQATKLGIEFEIICLDDCSKTSISEINSSIQKLPNTQYLQSKTNNGIAITRESLSNASKYDWILLIDADTFPKSKQYIETYIKQIKLNNKIVFGGFKYKKDKPPTKELLRWTYGKKNEEVPAKKRNKNPYKVIIAANLLIKKTTYQNFKLYEIGKNYGMDLLFGSKLKQSKATVTHIDNEVFHLGLENSFKFLEKSKKAIRTLLELDKNKLLPEHSNSILIVFKQIKQLKAHYLFGLLFKKINAQLSKNLLGSSPNIYLLQLYKICYMCNYHIENVE